MTQKFDRDKTINNAKTLKYPTKFKKIDFENKQIIGCVPLQATPVQPDDQSPCILENCGSCNEPMWVSEIKRKHRDSKPNVEIYCFLCIVLSQKAQGYNKPFETADLGSIN